MRQIIEEYSHFKVADFVLDSYFIDWVKNPDEESNEFWSRFVRQYPNQQSDIDAAKDMLLQFDFKKDDPSYESKEKVWKRIIAAKEETNSAKVIPISSEKGNRKWWLAAASVLIIVFAGGIFWYQNQSNTQLAQTTYGEKKEIILPDKSVVLLNANSKVEYAVNMNQKKVREVWIDGEALFTVTHKNRNTNDIKDGERFVVHLSNMDVEVLGTTFTVTDRQEKQNVVLAKGSVKITSKDGETILMKPGDKILYSSKGKKLLKEVVDTEKYTSWKDNRLTFENTSLAEVAKMIEDNYGYKVQVNDPSLLDKRITGTVSSENTTVLFKALEVIFNANLRLEGDTLIISKK